MREHLILTGVGRDQPGIVNSLSKAISDTGGSIEESRMSVLGGEFAIIVLVSGAADVIAKLEKEVASLGKQTGLSIQARHTKQKPSSHDILRYQVEVISMDQPGIVHSVTRYFNGRKINIESLTTETYAAPHSGTPMFALDIIVEIPAETSISDLRQSFGDYCDVLNIDASLEQL